MKTFAQINKDELLLLKSNQTGLIYLKISDQSSKNALRLNDMNIVNVFASRKLDILCSLHDLLIKKDAVKNFISFGSILKQDRSILRRYFADGIMKYFLKVSHPFYNFLTICPTLGLGTYNYYQGAEIVGSLNDLEIEV